LSNWRRILFGVATEQCATQRTVAATPAAASKAKQSHRQEKAFQMAHAYLSQSG
jgi:hypothetical protein